MDIESGAGVCFGEVLSDFCNDCMGTLQTGVASAAKDLDSTIAPLKPKDEQIDFKLGPPARTYS